MYKKISHAGGFAVIVIAIVCGAWIEYKYAVRTAIESVRDEVVVEHRCAFIPDPDTATSTVDNGSIYVGLSANDTIATQEDSVILGQDPKTGRYVVEHTDKTSSITDNFWYEKQRADCYKYEKDKMDSNFQDLIDSWQ